MSNMSMLQTLLDKSLEYLRADNLDKAMELMSYGEIAGELRNMSSAFKQQIDSFSYDVDSIYDADAKSTLTVYLYCAAGCSSTVEFHVRDVCSKYKVECKLHTIAGDNLCFKVKRIEA